MLDATGPSRPRNAGRYRPFASAECWTLPALRVRGMLDATGPSRPRNAGRYWFFASAECWTLPALRVRGMLDATGPSRPRNAGRYRFFASAECWTLPALIDQAARTSVLHAPAIRSRTARTRMVWRFPGG